MKRGTVSVTNKESKANVSSTVVQEHTASPKVTKRHEKSRRKLNWERAKEAGNEEAVIMKEGAAWTPPSPSRTKWKKPETEQRRRKPDIRHMTRQTPLSREQENNPVNAPSPPEHI